MNNALTAAIESLCNQGRTYKRQTDWQKSKDWTVQIDADQLEEKLRDVQMVIDDLGLDRAQLGACDPTTVPSDPEELMARTSEAIEQLRAIGDGGDMT